MTQVIAIALHTQRPRFESQETFQVAFLKGSVHRTPKTIPLSLENISEL